MYNVHIEAFPQKEKNCVLLTREKVSSSTSEFQGINRVFTVVYTDKSRKY